MELGIESGLTLTEEQAVEKILALGLHPVVAEVPPAKNEFHWHDFDSVFYILERGLNVTDMETGQTTAIVEGDWVNAPSAYAHREEHDGFKAVFGFSVDPATLKFPLELPLPVSG
jgi:hypothetical protein